MRIIIISFCLLLYPTLTIAEDFMVSGFFVRVFWKMENDKLRAWGEIQNGRRCESLGIKIRFTNSSEDDFTAIQTISNIPYNPKVRTTFSGKSRKFHKYKTSYWHVDEIKIDCSS